MRVAILEQQVVGEREERAAQRGIDRQLVVGPLDGAERHAQRVDLLALVERLAADEQVRHAARLERLDVGRVTSSPKLVKRRNRRQTCRPAPARALAAAAPLEPSSRSPAPATDEGADRVRQRRLDAS